MRKDPPVDGGERARCRWCGSDGLGVVLDLGAQPPSDHFPLADDDGPDRTWPLRMALCPACGLAQLVEDPGTVELPLGVEPQALVEQAGQAVQRLTRDGPIRRGASVIEFDSPHGGSWRSLLSGAGCLDRTGEPGAQADLVVDVFGLMHEADQAAALRARVACLAPGGSLLLQYHPLDSIVRQQQWNALRHGHMAYYSTAALVGMLTALDMTAVRAWTFPLYGGTVLLQAVRTGPVRVDASLAALLDADEHAQLTRPAGLAPLATSAAADAAELHAWLVAHRDGGRKVVGYAAASRAVPLLVRAGVDAALLPAVADGSPAKRGRRLPTTGIPIVPAAQLARRDDDVVLLFVPDLLDEVRAAFPQVEARGARWAVSEPRPHLLEPRPR